eukprot:15478248-Alexandrium_andersonii.AAC.1
MPVPVSGLVPPEPPAWASMLSSMAWLPNRLGRPLRVAEPCCGVACATEALHAMGIDTTPGPAWDIQKFLAKPLETLYGTLDHIHLGEDGNVLN